MAINISNEAAWSCCYLKYEGNGGCLNGSGVIVEFDAEPQAYLPSLQKLSSPPETRYALLTCHHIIPDLQEATQDGWRLWVGPGKNLLVHELKSLVCGAVSCCGEDGVISSGTLRSKMPILVSHQGERCELNLDFTMLFLNQNFEKQMKKKGMTRLLQVHIHMDSSSVPRHLQALFSQIESNTASGNEAQMHLCHRGESDLVNFPVEVDLGASTDDDDSQQQLKKEVAKYKKYQRIDYTESKVPGNINDGYSGSALVYYDSATGETQLVGIHIGVAMDKEESITHTAYPKWYIGVSIHAIIQLLSGHPAAFFAVMEHHPARRMWTFRWAHLLIHQLENCKNSLPLGYQVEILQQLLDKSKKPGLIRIDLSDPSTNIVATLQVLSAVFKSFEMSRYPDVVKAIEMVFADDNSERKIKEFHESVADLTKDFPDLLVYIGTDNDEMAKACSKYYRIMLFLKKKGIVQGELHSDQSLRFWRQLCKRYNCPEILRDFNDILCLNCQIRENKLVEEYETELQRQKEEYQGLLQQYKENLRQRFQQSVEKLKKEKGDAIVAAFEQHNREATILRGELEQVKEEKQALEERVQKQEQRKGKLENELEEMRQKTHQQFTTAKDETENWKRRTAVYERQTSQLCEELQQAKAEINKLHRQLGENISGDS